MRHDINPECKTAFMDGYHKGRVDATRSIVEEIDKMADELRSDGTIRGRLIAPSVREVARFVSDIGDWI